MITQINNHRVQHGNIMDGIEELMMNQKADFIYSDPPWGQGNLRYWQTMNKKMNNVERNDVLYTDFIKHFFSLIYEYSKDKVVIEYGCQWNQDIVDISKRLGFKHNGSTICYYKSGSILRPCDLHFLSKTSTITLTDFFKEECIKRHFFLHYSFFYS